MKNNRILTEWIKVNSGNTKPNGTVITDYTNRFQKLIDHVKNIHTKVDVRLLEDDIVRFYYVDGTDEYRVEITYNFGQGPLDMVHEKVKPATNDQPTHISFGDDYDKLLDTLLKLGVIKNKKLCESKIISTLDDFKDYENLWT